MTPTVRGALSLAVACIALPAAAGCGAESSQPSAEDQTRAADAKKYAKIDGTVRRELSSAIAVADACKDDRTEACMIRVLTEMADGTHPSSLRPLDGWGLGTVKSLVTKASNIGRGAICAGLGWALKNARVYYMNGISGQAAMVGYVTGGAERVWDLTLHQAVGYVYGGGGAGNVSGFSASVYEGYAVAAQGGGLHDNWDGCFLGTSVSVAIPLTQIGGGFSTFRGCSLGAKNVVDFVTAVQGVAWHADAGLNVANEVAVTAQAGATYYVALNLLTRGMHSSYTDDLIADDRGEFLSFKYFQVPGLGDRGKFSPGYTQAVNMLFNGATLGTLGAAAIAIGYDAIDGNQDYCNSRAEVLPCGGSGGGLSTAACSGGGDGDEEIWPPVEVGGGSNGGGTTTDTPPTPAPTADPVTSCALDDHCSEGDVCSPNGPDTYCCRPKFDVQNARPCDPGIGGCGPDEICAMGANTDDPSLAFTCIDPKAHPCSATNP